MYKKWLIIDILKRKGNTLIYNVKPVIDDETCEIIKNNLNGRKWVLKYIKNINSHPYTEEIDNIEKYELHKSQFCITMPDDNSYRSGIYDNKSWYVMQKYDGSLKEYFLFGKNNIKLLLSNIIDSLEWFHTTKKRVYGDMKIDNILINFNDNKTPFCLIDYESITEPNTNTCIKDLPNGYYYFGLGCSSDKPYMSYRMDLQAFGYILWSLTLSVDSHFIFNWQSKAFNYYDDNKITSEFDDLVKVRFTENTTLCMNDLIKSYFNIISGVDWLEVNPNPEIYKKIKNLISPN